ncbi:MAG: inositol monophosphatase family protein [Rhodospirillales bacterium]|nr:inositol monophosphatase family protein [Rhodospirillales bacterium]
MASRSPLLNVMTAAAHKAARGLVRDLGELEHLQVSKKGPADYVSKADHRAERILRGELSKARPTYGLLMEESGAVEGSDTSNRWVVDPLDGTTNFLHGIPHFCISIALERDGEPFAGVIYSPVYDEMYVAEKGAGAYLNGRRLRVSARRSVDEALFATGIPFRGIPDHELFLEQLRSVMQVSAGVRRFGSAALDLAYVAAGRYDGYWENGLNPWDVAAGIVIVREAGGFVTDLAGGKGMLHGGGILAANSSLHPELRRLLAEAGKTAAAAAAHEPAAPGATEPLLP